MPAESVLQAAVDSMRMALAAVAGNTPAVGHTGTRNSCAALLLSRPKAGAFT